MTQVTIILGAGYTGRRLAARLRARGEAVFALVRGVARFGELADLGVHLSELNLSSSNSSELPRQAKLALLIPPVPEPDRTALRSLIERLEPARLVYVSSTGVYGRATEVDENTSPDASDQRAKSRIEDENWLLSQPWSSLILRAAAIYGPGRGVHAALLEGRAPRGTGSAVVSRVHVDDLVSLIEAGLKARLEGAWPVADDDPCSTDEIVRWCLEHFRIPPEAVSPAAQIAGRRVNGRRVFKLLGLEARYPSWRTGIPASIREDIQEERGESS